MREFRSRIVTAMLLLTFIAAPSIAGTGPDTTLVASNKTAEAIRVEILLNRLDEIKAMDKSTLNKSEKRQLRKEVREIKKEMNGISGGVYLSVGAIIVIVLLLILLL